MMLLSVPSFVEQADGHPTREGGVDLRDAAICSRTIPAGKAGIFSAMTTPCRSRISRGWAGIGLVRTRCPAKFRVGYVPRTCR